MFSHVSETLIIVLEKNYILIDITYDILTVISVTPDSKTTKYQGVAFTNFLEFNDLEKSLLSKHWISPKFVTYLFFLITKVVLLHESSRSVIIRFQPSFLVICVFPRLQSKTVGIRFALPRYLSLSLYPVLFLHHKSRAPWNLSDSIVVGNFVKGVYLLQTLYQPVAKKF